MKLKTGLGLAFGIVLIAWIFSRYHIGDAAAFLARADTLYLIPLPLFFAASYVTRAARWKVLFDKTDRPRIGTLLRSLMVGHMMNNFLPARAGDVARIYLLGQRAVISKSIVLATVVLEKVGDLIITACLISVVLVSLPASAWIRSAGYALGMSSLAGVLVILLVPIFGMEMLTLLRRYLHFLPHAVYERLLTIAENLITGIRSGTKVRGLVYFAAYSIVIWAMEILVMMFIAKSLDIQLGLIPSLFVMLTIAVGAMIPAAPGSLGTFEYFSLTALALVGIDGSAALAFTVLYHAVLLLGTTLGGLFFLVLPGRQKLLELLKRGDAARQDV
ncbi:lysylphosphatidylglycerol synthase transmembrane domain-containing protein [Polaromonas sp. YR568]|uniref:lysylphosphatidylglycerol synthase transmembrane domain-containing protein n=1 Tax=Polaromonas sp. YR568 TaxID=1855301 RepID=UPI00398BE2AA